MRPKTDRHHRLPKSRGGTNHPRNLIRLPVELHIAWHTLVGNATAPEAAKILSDYIDPDYVLVAQRRKTDE